MNTIILKEIQTLVDSADISWSEFKNKTILITGGTGLIGSLIIQTLAIASKKYELGINIIALVRNIENAKIRLSISSNCIRYLEGNVETFSWCEGDIDYIIHAAYPTSSVFFNTSPVETIKSGVQGTLNLLDFAVKKGVKRFVFVSSMEVYGRVKDEHLLQESQLGYIDLYSSRSCYSESKRMCENIVSCYTKEYGCSASCIRLAQTFGPGVSLDDKRIFAMMAKCAINNCDIVLNTKGESKHPYLYSVDAVSAILTVLIKGKSNTCYNAANPETYCSIYEMGTMVAERMTGGAISVRLELKNTDGLYPPTSYLNLDISSLSHLGWSPRTGLMEMFDKMIGYMKASNSTNFEK